MVVYTGMTRKTIAIFAGLVLAAFTAQAEPAFVSVTDASAFGLTLAHEIEQEGGYPSTEVRYMREATGAQIYGYHSEEHVAEFVKIANKAFLTNYIAYLDAVDLNLRQKIAAHRPATATPTAAVTPEHVAGSHQEIINGQEVTILPQ
jgi:hypothetical protein